MHNSTSETRRLIRTALLVEQESANLNWLEQKLHQMDQEALEGSHDYDPLGIMEEQALGLEEAIEIIDTSGATSWNDLAESMDDYEEDPSWWTAGHLILAVLAVIPVLGALSKVNKLGKIPGVVRMLPGGSGAIRHAEWQAEIIASLARGTWGRLKGMLRGAADWIRRKSSSLGSKADEVADVTTDLMDDVTTRVMRPRPTPPASTTQPFERVTEKIPDSVQREGRKMRITRGNLRQIIREELQHSLREAEIIDLAQTAGLPWEFGSSGYAARGRGLERKMAHLGRESSRRDAEILAVALSNRAEELINFERAVDPRFFDDFADDLAQRLGSGWFGGGETHEDLGSIVSKIDAGDYFDEEIDAVPMWREGEWQEEETAPWSVKDLSQMYDPQADPSEWGVKDLSDTHGPEEF